MTAVTTVTGLTADRMIEMEEATIIDGEVVGNNLHLQTRGGTDIDAGNVRGPQGPQGVPGTNGTNGTNGINGSGAFRCTSTTRPTGLVAADEGYLIYETDTDLYRTWSGTRWKCQERVICTSSTRPAGLVAADEGVYAYCTDLNYGYTWDGTRWAIDGWVRCTSTTRPVGLTAADEGIKIYETDTDTEYIFTGASYVMSLWTPHMAIAKFVPSTAGNVSGTAYADWPPPVSGGPLSVPGFVKQRADTRISARMMGAGYIVTSTTHRITMGVRSMPDNTDREIFRTHHGDPINQFHRPVAGEVSFAMAAGTYDFTGRCKTDAGAGVTAWQTDTQDSWSLAITESLE